jgi:hypothetical protein
MPGVRTRRSSSRKANADERYIKLKHAIDGA